MPLAVDVHLIASVVVFSLPLEAAGAVVSRIIAALRKKQGEN